jgi:hypothetical protein
LGPPRFKRDPDLSFALLRGKAPVDNLIDGTKAAGT